ncbi:MAG: chemotaxis protein CheW [Treponema sp.]|nr:chemotaxis protein CheW [Treponema sp.]MCL2252070.1 chemotaxis protein CheW [Treponema sp.]
MSEITENNIETVNPEEHTETHFEKFLVFSIMEKLYCFPSRLIGEIALFDTVYPLPLLPSFVLGVVNRYSVPYALFDIGLLFYKTPLYSELRKGDAAGVSRKKVLIFKDEIDKIAVLIDDVTGIADIQQENILPIERNAEINDITEAISASFKWNDENVFVIDIQKILTMVGGETF